jgi:hypothetical protein
VHVGRVCYPTGIDESDKAAGIAALSVERSIAIWEDSSPRAVRGTLNDTIRGELSADPISVMGSIWDRFAPQPTQDCQERESG